MKARAEVAAKVRLAAEDVASGRKVYSCIALRARSHFFPLVHRYEALFCAAPKDWLQAPGWLSSAQTLGYIDEQDMLDWRVTALCFLAAMIESGDLDDVI